ncbi:MAG: hypothetical protein OXH19_09975 [Chloroflexi bacterium]|nr:hypothetical protein [Chloroflexota bacterium]MCY3589442.1 hypothetical protein [Chloroflexota bacterium]MCY3685002.1 hypothetical protein [Chloroflexota bacterium]MDE2707656.1 hypothetical protein [Chloroflexota bacterium]
MCSPFVLAGWRLPLSGFGKNFFFRGKTAPMPHKTLEIVRLGFQVLSAFSVQICSMLDDSVPMWTALDGLVRV